MAVLSGILAIAIFWVLGVIVICGGVFYLFATVGVRKQPPAPRPAPQPPAPARTRAPAPGYIRRWGLHRRAAVIADKADWQRSFDDLQRR